MIAFSSLSLAEYTKQLGSDVPAPGGGSAAALMGAMGSALLEMTCRINTQRKKSNPDWNQSSANATKSSHYREMFLDLITQDVEAFSEITRHWKNKSPALQKALIEASKVPAEMAKIALECLALAEEEIPRTSRHLVSDLAESGMLLHGALKAAHMNTESNLRLIEDNDFVSQMRREMKERFQESRVRSQNIEQIF